MPQCTEDSAGLKWLIFGKKCGTDGAVLPSSGNDVVAASAGFPDALRPLCWPSYTGLDESVKRAGGPAGERHVSALLPVLNAGNVSQVYVRLRLRPQDGEQGRARNFLLAHFFAVPHGVDIWPAYQAIARVPFLVPSGPVDLLPPVPLDPSLQSRHGVVGMEPNASGEEAVDADLVQQVCTWVLLAIPVAIEDPISERAFFALADAVSRSLPAPVRGLFSAGWCVPSQDAERYSLCAMTSATGAMARYLPQSKTWSRPVRGLERSAEGISLVPLSRERLSELVYEGQAAAAYRMTPAMEAHLQRKVDESLAALGGEVLPTRRSYQRWDQQTWMHTRFRCFRALGWMVRDDMQLHELHTWLDQPGPMDAAAKPPRMEFSEPGIATRATEIVMEALADSNRRGRADQAMYWLLNHKADGIGRAKDAILKTVKASKVRGYRRARLLQCLVNLKEENYQEMLERYDEAVAAGEGGGLSLYQGSLERGLDLPLQSAWTPPAHEVLQRYHRLLTADPLPDELLIWLRRQDVTYPMARGFRLLLYLVRYNHAKPEGLVRVAEQIETRGTRMFVRWAKAEPPADEDKDVQTFRSESPVEYDSFCNLVETAWDGRADSRQRALPWAVLFHRNRDTLLSMKAGEQMQEGDILTVNAQVRQKSVPVGLYDVVSHAMLRHWVRLAGLVHDPESIAAWKEVTRNLSSATLELLHMRDATANNRLDAIPEEVDERFLMERSLLGADGLEVILKDWAACQAGVPPLQAARLKEWLLSFAGTAILPPRVAVLQAMLENRLPHLEYLDRDVGTQCARLRRAMDPTPTAGLLWEQANLPWKLMLVAELFPSGNVVLSMEQERILIQLRRTWLLDYLKDSAVSEERRTAWSIFSEAFMSLPKEKWKDSYSGRLCSWAFEDLGGGRDTKPISLNEAMCAYALNVSERSRCCLLYLRKVTGDQAGLLELLNSYPWPCFQDRGRKIVPRKEVEKYVTRGIKSWHKNGQLPARDDLAYHVLNMDDADFMDEIAKTVEEAVWKGASKAWVYQQG